MMPMWVFLPWLVGALIAIFQAAVTFFLQFITRKFAMVAAATVVFVSLTAALVIALNVVITGIAYTMPSSITLAISWFMPSNFITCISAYYSAVTLKYVYDLKFKILKCWT